MNRRPLILLTVVAVVSIAGFIIDRQRAAASSTLSGYFDTLPAEISSRVQGRVSKLFVREGDFVKAGQPIAELEATTSEASLVAQEAGAEQAKQNYLMVKRGSRAEDIARQRAVVAEARADYDKLRNGNLPEDIRSAASRVRQARERYEKLARGNRAEDIAAAKAASDQAYQKYLQALRGDTPEARGQYQARYRQALAAEDLARKNFLRIKALYDQGVDPRSELDSAQSQLAQAVAGRVDAEEAMKRSQEGSPKEELNQAKAAYEQAKANYDAMRNGSRVEDVAAAKEDLRQAEEAYALMVKGPRKEDIDAALARLRQAQAALDELVNGSRPEDIAKAKAAADEAQNQYLSLQATVRERRIFAPTDGVVQKVEVAVGQLVSPGGSLVQIQDPKDIWIRVYIPERDLAKVKPGDSAKLAVDGITEFVEGRVETVATQGEFTPANLQTPEERGKQVFAVRIRLAKPDERVKAGMYATVKEVGQWH